MKNNSTRKELEERIRGGLILYLVDFISFTMFIDRYIRKYKDVTLENKKQIRKIVSECNRNMWAITRGEKIYNDEIKRKNDQCLRNAVNKIILIINK